MDDHSDNEIVNEVYFSDEGEKSFHSEDEAVEDNTLNGDGEKKAEEPKSVKVKRPVLNPQPKLNFQALQGPKGLLALNSLFADFKYRGSGHELEDLTAVLKGLDQWAYRLFPRFHFEDSLKRMEALGKKREVQVYLRKIRNGMIDSDDVVRQVDEDEDNPPPQQSVEAHDAFDDLLSQQIARTQPDLMSNLSDEQKARIERNKRLAMEKRLQKKVQSPSENENVDMAAPEQETLFQDEAVISEVHDVNIEFSDIQMPSTSAIEASSMDIELLDQPTPSTSATVDIVME